MHRKKTDIRVTIIMQLVFLIILMFLFPSLRNPVSVVFYVVGSVLGYYIASKFTDRSDKDVSDR